jgi:hypothetical protein
MPDVVRRWKLVRRSSFSVGSDENESLDVGEIEAFHDV